jgi:hypothetical protein
MKQKTKGRKKLTRSGRNRAKYERQTYRTRANKRRRQSRREKQLAFFKTNPMLGSPSQVALRHKLERKHAKTNTARN